MNMKVVAKVTIALAACSAIGTAHAEGVRFEGVFAPSEGYVNRLEKPLRDEVCLNGRWDFQPVALPKDWKQGKGVAPELAPPSADGWEKVKIKIPSPWNVNDFCFRKLEGPDHRNYPSYPDSWKDVKMGWLRRTVKVPTSWAGKRVLLRFEAVAGQAVVMVNGEKVAENFDLFLPFEADVTRLATPGNEIEILVGVRSQSLFEDRSGVGRRIVPAGSMWGTFVNGIWQDVYLLARPEASIADVFVRPLVSKKKLALDVTLRNDGAGAAELSLGGKVNMWINRAGTDVLSAPVPAWELACPRLTIDARKVALAPGETKTVTVETAVADGTFLEWTPETPNLYMLTTKLVRGNETADVRAVRFGWREWTVCGADYLLNGKPYRLRGDSWHFMGVPQMTRRYAWAWFKALKDANANAVRLHAQVYPSFYHDVADEMGICILDETSNWASDGGPKLDSEVFWRNSLDHLARFVRRDRNHPSVFGWSVSNENKPVIKHVFARPDLMPQQEKAWRDWRDAVQALDPTRPWISADGEEDGEGILPTTVGHYGDANSMKKWRGIGKPWGVGETSMAYYGTPEQTSKFNGDRSYESALGRMEALANECYNLIKMQRDSGATYACVFNLAWYALKPLPFGKRDLAAEPSLEDGVFFGEYVEGRPGMQPERIGPYSSTFNPGYDPALPLYATWPMFDAIRAANAPGGPAWSQWAEVEKKGAFPELAAPAPQFAEVVFFGDAKGKLKAALDAQGVIFSDAVTKGAFALALVDASKKLADAEFAKLKAAAASGAELWLWGLSPDTLAAYEPVIGKGLEVFPLVRSTFIPQRKPLMAGLGNSDFYFCELQNADVTKVTFGGAWVERGEVLLESCRTDWRRWNKRAEEMKTAAIIRSERECTSPRAAIVRGTNGKGPVTLFALVDFANSEKGYKTLAKILRNAGVACREMKQDPAEQFFVRDGKMRFPTVTRQRLKEKDGRCTLTFWVYSNRPLDDLLIEPDMPKVTLFVKSRHHAKLLINGVSTDIDREGGREAEFKEIPRKQGWNRLDLETVGPRHEFDAEIRCDNKREFLSLMKASLKEPE